MDAFKVKENIYWVGAIDWNLRDFHGYSTDRGGTYNAYLIIDEKITLIDNVYAPFASEMISRIKSVIDPSKIDIIISNHSEPDHSGSIHEVLKYAPNAKIYASGPAGVKSMVGTYHDIKVIPVKTDEVVNIGKRDLKFIQTPLVHWPDNMVTYSAYDKILFSNDMLGQHIASFKRFDDEYELEFLLDELKKYYANIVLPYGAQTQKALTAVRKLDIELIATSHGAIWRSHIKEALDLYEKMSTYQKVNKAVVVYDSMWGSTEKLALEIAESFDQASIQTLVRNVRKTPLSDIISDLTDASYIAVGSPTLNNGLMPSMAAFLCYLKGLNPRNLSYLVFGSFGWGGQGVTLATKELEEMGFKQIVEPIRVQYAPSAEQVKVIKKDITDTLLKLQSK
ncbi:MAG: FprA family A-type flavoprotein [Acholeplasmataceae bacterium]|nr:FprA family A-type flavoprotein [Acholeplasmataceae bacterium]